MDSGHCASLVGHDKLTDTDTLVALIEAAEILVLLHENPHAIRACTSLIAAYPATYPSLTTRNAILRAMSGDDQRPEKADGFAEPCEPANSIGSRSPPWPISINTSGQSVSNAAIR